MPVMAPAPQIPPLKLEVVGPAQCNLGAPLQYDIVVRNTGSLPATQVHVEERLSADAVLLSSEPQAEVHEDRLAWELGTLGPETERRFRVMLQPVREGEFVSRATVSCAAISSLQTRIVQPPLQLRALGPESLPVGEEGVFDFQVSNPSAVSVRNVMVRDRLPAGFRHPQGEFIETALGTLAPGQTKKLTLRAVAVQAGRYVNEAVVSAGEGMQASVRSTVVVTGGAMHPRPPEAPNQPEPVSSADLLLEVADRDDPIEIGAETEYEIRVHNRGDSPSTGVRLMAAVPGGMSFVGASGPTDYLVQGPNVFFEPLARLASGAEERYHVRVRGRQAGDWRFKVRLNTDQGGRPLQEEQGTRVYGN
jgi:uncharacterized repeat protein (TIGR01451 family)